MHKTLIVLGLMIISLSAQAADEGPLASWPPRVDWQSAAKLATNPNPPGCLRLQSENYTLEGRLGGVAWPADSQEDPPVEAHSFIYFILNTPISVCASKESLGRAWTNVTRLALGVHSNEFYHYLVKYWGQWEHVRLTTATLVNVNTALPGPVGVDNFSQICFRGYRSGKIGSEWWCMSNKAWSHLFKESQEWIDKWR